MLGGDDDDSDIASMRCVVAGSWEGQRTQEAEQSFHLEKALTLG